MISILLTMSRILVYSCLSLSYLELLDPFLLNPAFFQNAGLLPSVSVSCFFICLVRKLFFKILLLLQLWTEYLDNTYRSSLGVLTFILCSSWRFGDLGGFCDISKFSRISGLVYRDATNCCSQLLHCWVSVSSAVASQTTMDNKVTCTPLFVLRKECAYLDPFQYGMLQLLFSKLLYCI